MEGLFSGGDRPEYVAGSTTPVSKGAWVEVEGKTPRPPVSQVGTRGPRSPLTMTVQAAPPSHPLPVTRPPGTVPVSRRRKPPGSCVGLPAASGDPQGQRPRNRSLCSPKACSLPVPQQMLRHVCPSEARFARGGREFPAPGLSGPAPSRMNSPPTGLSPAVR